MSSAVKIAVSVFRNNYCSVNGRDAFMRHLPEDRQAYFNEEVTLKVSDLSLFNKECEKFKTNRIRFVPSAYPVFTELARKLITTYVYHERRFILHVMGNITDITFGRSTDIDIAQELCNNYYARFKIAYLISSNTEFMKYFLHNYQKWLDNVYSVHIGDLAEIPSYNRSLYYAIVLSRKQLADELRQSVQMCTKI